MADVTTINKVQRLSKIKELLDEGKNESDITKELDIPIITVRKYVKLLDEVSIADISPTEKGKRRAELYVELQEAAEQAKLLFDETSRADKPQAARGYFKSWLETIEMRMKLFGLDTIKPTSNLTQINQYMNPVQPDKIPTDIANRISSLIKKNHEDKVNK